MNINGALGGTNFWAAALDSRILKNGEWDSLESQYSLSD